MRVRQLLAAISLSLIVIFSTTASALAATDTNPIWSGLWQGYNMTAGSSSDSSHAKVYAALGDSVAAGLGLKKASGGTSRDTQCGRSPQAYTTAIARATNLPIINAACSGATAGDIFTKQGVSGPNIPPQLDAAFAQGTPKLMTITAGANDAHWRGFLQACYATNCATSASTAAANAYLVSLQLKLYYMFYSIQSRSTGTPPKVYVTGYYNPLSNNCLGSRISANEMAWLNAEATALNQTIQNVTNTFSSFATFVPISFAGHDICASTPWVQGLSAKAPFHPTATGQQAIAKAILAKM
jgi:lysophospholipase L1-like esterase